MTERGQPLPYPLDECAGCRDLTEQLARSTHAYQLLAEAQQQLAQAQAEIAQLKTLYEADMGRTLPEVER